MDRLTDSFCYINSSLTGDHDGLGVAVLEEGDVAPGDQAGVQPRGGQGRLPNLHQAQYFARKFT